MKPLEIGLLIKKLILFPFALLFGILSVIGIIIAYIPVLISCIVYKFIVLCLAKCFLPKNAKFLSGLDNLLAHGEVYSDKSMYVCLNLIFEGRMDPEIFMEDWNEKLIKGKRGDGTLKYPELQSYIKTWMGYSFYLPDENFDLKNHYSVYDNNNLPVDRRKFNKIRYERVSSLFPGKRSPWEVTIIHNYEIDDNDNDNYNSGDLEIDGISKKEYSIVIFKYHHCLADGYSTLKLLYDLYDKEVSELNSLKNNEKHSIFKRIYVFSASLFQSLFLLGEIPFYSIYSPKSKVFDINSWHQPIKPNDLGLILWSLKPLETTAIKEISVANNVSITSVLISACTGAFRRMMEARGKKSPKEIFTSMSFNLPDPPDRLRTNSFTMRFNNPICGVKTGKERLAILNKRMATLIRLNLVIMAPLTVKILKFLPSSFNLKSKKSTLFVTSSFVSVPLPSFDIDAQGCKLIQTYHNFELTQVNASFSVSVLKLRTHFFVTFGIQRKLLNNEDEISGIDHYFQEEVRNLKAESVSV